jgi:DNA-binding MarR family transcriptional regulator
MAADDTGVAAWRATQLAQSRAQRAVERDMEAAGAVPLSWYDVMFELNAAPQKRLRMQELVTRVAVSRSRVSRIVADLEAAGYVEREADRNDGRASVPRITAQGREALRRSSPVFLKAVRTHFVQYLSPDDRPRIAKAFANVIVAHTPGDDTRP